ncbi:hypothetical protein ACJ6WF_17135 [Streptomyces sp. MMS24-I2-30]|uniref:hypothetical protein n=1 Tax=Streptomyces sp. MMS24-I2-30 TaxID=3351564 RepID=UPI003896E05A
MSGKKEMTPEEAVAALKAEAAKNAARAERDAIWVTCDAGHIQYSGTRGCIEPGCPHY